MTVINHMTNGTIESLVEGPKIRVDLYPNQASGDTIHFTTSDLTLACSELADIFATTGKRKRQCSFMIGRSKVTFTKGQALGLLATWLHMVTTMTDYCDSNGHIELIDAHIARAKAAWNVGEWEKPTPAPYISNADIPSGWEEAEAGLAGTGFEPDMTTLHPRAKQLLEDSGETTRLKLGKTMKWVDLDVRQPEPGATMMQTVNQHIDELDHDHKGAGHVKGCNIDLAPIEADTIMAALIWWDACRKVNSLPGALTNLANADGARIPMHGDDIGELLYAIQSSDV